MRIFTPLLALACGAIIAGPSWAQRAVSITSTATALSVTSGNCLAANGSRRSLALDNTGGTINIGYCFTTPGSAACTAAIGTAPTTTLAAGSLHYWESAPQNQICFVAASSTPSVTIREGM